MIMIIQDINRKERSFGGHTHVVLGNNHNLMGKIV